MAQPLPLVLCILDGWGHREAEEGNAVRLAEAEEIATLSARYPHLLLRASGPAVGLPEGQIGNSEVGHLAIGAGRPVEQILTRAMQDVESSGLEGNPGLTEALRAACADGTEGRTLHLLGLVSEGGVHSHQALAEETVRLASRFRCPDGGRIERVRIHAFLDGRDTPPRSAEGFLDRLQGVLDDELGRIATLSGRFFAMDRDGNWERTEKAWRALVLGEGRQAPSWRQGLRDAYAREETDEFVEPTVIRGPEEEPGDGRIRDGDSVVFFNFRADRARQMTRSLAFEDFDGFSRPERPELSRFTTFAPYDEDWDLPVVYRPDRPSAVLGRVLSEAGRSQYRVAETEKYAHVTYFLNGGREGEFEGEERALIPSEKLRSYAEAPAMRAEEITEAVEGILGEDPEAVVVVNFANADMVGHSGDLEATIEACRVVDRCVGRLARSLRDRGGAMLLTADHGNAELMVDPTSGGPHTAHTTNPVPCVLVWEDLRGGTVPEEAGLQDVTPTLLDLLEIRRPEEMAGRSLLESRGPGG